jgi:hypothetical protein
MIVVAFAAAREDEIRDHVSRPYDVEPSPPDDPWVREIRAMPVRARDEARTAASQAMFMRQHKESDIRRRAQLGHEVRGVRGDTRRLCKHIHSRARHEYGRELRHTRATKRAGPLAQLYLEEGGAFSGFREFLGQNLAPEAAPDDDEEDDRAGGRLDLSGYDDPLEGESEDDEGGGGGRGGSGGGGNGGFALIAATTWAVPDDEALILESQTAETVDHTLACDWASSLTEEQREAILEMMRTGGDGYAEDHSFVMELMLCTFSNTRTQAPTSQLNLTTPEQGLVFQGQSATTSVVVLQDGSPDAAQAAEPARSTRVQRSRRGGRRRRGV